MQFLAYDGPIAQGVRYIWKLMVLNVLFILCSLPVFTFGASVTALYAVFLNESLESGTVRRFFRAFGENFKQATLIWLIWLGVGVLLVLSVLLMQAVEMPGEGLFRLIQNFLLLVYASSAAFVFPLQAKFENTVGQTVKNGCILGVIVIFKGLLMAALNFLPVILFLWNLGLFLLALPLWTMVGFSLTAQLNSLLVKKTFLKWQPSEEESQEEI